MTAAVGQAAPDFSLPASSGETVTLSQFRGRPVVLFFYPKDDTPGCTVEACTFRDRYDEFVDAGATVIGVSSDSVESHERFASKRNLPMVLLSDRSGEVRALYGVRASLGILPGRATYVIDPQGIVRHIFVSQLRVRQHAAEAIAAIRQFAPASS